MPLEPGQIEEINLQIQEIEHLTALRNKLKGMLSSTAVIGFSQYSDEIQNQIRELNAKIAQEITDVKEQLKASEEKTTNVVAQNNLIKQMASECSDYINAFKATKKVLLRGVKQKVNSSYNTIEFYQGRSWLERAPKDSNALAQQIYDQELKAMGIKALRSNSIFTTTEFVQAEDYGKVYIIIPKNTANFSWSQLRHDVVLRLKNFLDVNKWEQFQTDFVTYLDKEWFKDKPAPSYQLRTILEQVVGSVYSNDMDTLKELGKKYNFEPIINFDINNYIDRSLIKTKFEPSDTDLESALKSGHEVLISGEYYAIKTDTDFSKLVLNALGLNPRNFIW